jgi:hypothetical protein
MKMMKRQNFEALFNPTSGNAFRILIIKANDLSIARGSCIICSGESGRSMKATAA